MSMRHSHDYETNRIEDELRIIAARRADDAQEKVRDRGRARRRRR